MDPSLLQRDGLTTGTREAKCEQVGSNSDQLFSLVDYMCHGPGQCLNQFLGGTEIKGRKEKRLTILIINNNVE